jgi:UDP-GlcNAc:undecaprenyl-phosphate GlcNAc-1-phosphate transferase
VSLGLVPLCRHAALRWGFTAQPKDDRWHRTPTALLGGVAIAVTVLGLQVGLGGWRTMPVILTGGTLIFLVGLFDDLFDLKPYAKLVAEIAIAALFVSQGYRLGWLTSQTLDTLLTMIWIVGLTNALNLLDNMDGLSAGTTLIAGSSLLAALWLASERSPELVQLALILGATAGFLVYNFHPASIFMGDGGSLFLGLNLAVLTLTLHSLGQASSSVLSIIAAPVLVLLVPIFDTTLVTASRFFSGRSAAQGGRDHSSHRLVAMGLSERRAVAVLWTLAGLGGLLALSIQRFQNDWASLAAAVFVLVMIILAVYLAHVRVYDDADPAVLRSGGATPVVFTFLYKRRLAEVLLDFCLVSLAYYLSYRLRFTGSDFGVAFKTFLASLPLVVGVQIVALFVFGGYRGVWRYFGLMDGVTFSKAVGVGTVASATAMWLWFGLRPFPKEVFMIYAALTMLALIASRASFRLIGEFARRRRHEGQRLIIYGSGDGAATAVRELLERHPNGYRMVGFIHDDPLMARTRMQGYPVLGGFASLVSLIENDAVDTVVITTPAIAVDQLEQLRALCTESGVSLARLHWRLDEIVPSFRTGFADRGRAG